MEGSEPATGIEDAYVRVFERDPTLLAGLDAATVERLRDLGTVPCVELAPGAWHPPTHRTSARGWVGLLVLDGMLARPVTVGDRRVNEILCSGDVLRPWDHPTWDGLVQPDRRWSVLTATTLAVLDQHFAAVAQRTTHLMVELLSRSQRRASQLAAGVAIAAAGDPAQRVGALVDYLGERVGTGSTGLTDTAVALAVQADRAAVVAALDQLVADGRIDRRAGCLVLPG